MISKNNEGALYIDNTTLKSGDKVEPGETYTYTWQVPARAGPSDTDTDCITWAYYSYVDPTKDTNSGLVGPLIICRKVRLGKCLNILSTGIMNNEIKKKYIRYSNPYTSYRQNYSTEYIYCFFRINQFSSQ